MSLVSKVKDLCDTKEITLAELERQLKFSNGSMSKWDKSSPSIDKVKKVADYFNITVSDLIGEDNKTFDEIIKNNFSSEILEMQKAFEKLSPKMQRRMMKMITAVAEDEEDE